MAGDGEPCPRCGATVAGQFCEACGFRVSARSPFAPLGHPAEPPEAPPSGRARSGPPESLFPPISEPEPPFSAWSRPEPLPAPPSPPRPAPAGPPEAPGRLETPRIPEDSGAVDVLESPFAPAPSPPQRTPAPSAPPTAPIPSLTGVTWTVLVASDRVYYDKMQTARGLNTGVEFPAHTSERRIRLVGKQMRIGRRSPARDLVPEIDLADQPVDPGISRLHAVLTPAPDGTWSILDPGSANGTLVNGRELAIGEMVTLHEGDRINLGAWTVITVHRG